MIGWDGNFDNKSEIHVRPVSNSLNLASIAENVNEEYNIGLNLEIVNPGSPNTDHSPFWLNNLSAIGISEEYQGDFNPFWHTLGDTLGNFNIPYYERNVRLALATFSTLAYNKSGNQTIEEIIKNSLVFPNPTETNLAIKFQQAITQGIAIEISNIYGEILKSTSFNNIDVIDIDFSNYSAGTYFIHLFTTDDSKIFKIQKI